MGSLQISSWIYNKSSLPTKGIVSTYPTKGGSRAAAHKNVIKGLQNLASKIKYEISQNLKVMLLRTSVFKIYRPNESISECSKYQKKS